MVNLKTFFVSLCAVLAGACQITNSDNNAQKEDRPARLSSTDTATLSSLKAALSIALKRANIELAPIDLDTSSVVSVLPPPLAPHETHSLAMPITFDLVLRSDGCYAVRQDDETDAFLDGVDCVAVE